MRNIRCRWRDILRVKKCVNEWCYASKKSILSSTKVISVVLTLLNVFFQPHTIWNRSGKPGSFVVLSAILLSTEPQAWRQSIPNENKVVLEYCLHFKEWCSNVSFIRCRSSLIDDHCPYSVPPLPQASPPTCTVLYVLYYRPYDLVYVQCTWNLRFRMKKMAT